MKKVLKQEGFRFGWKPVSIKPAIVKGEFYGMREWQSRAFSALKDARYAILNAPMGSGKSWLMCLLSAYKLKNNPQQRCIISVPQTVIASGFEEANLLLPNDEELRWFVQHNLCSDATSEGTIKAVIKFLHGPHGFFQDRILLCTHATLVAVYKRLKENGKLSLLSDLLLWIDEAHHVKNAEASDFEGAIISNGIGELVAHVLTHENLNVHVGLATASFFRGDRCSLLTAEMEKQFVRFNLPYDEYLESMQYLRSFSFDFLVCGPDFTKAISQLLKARTGKDIIYIPHPKSRHSTGDKYREVEEIIAHYQDVHGGKEVDTDDGITVLQKRKTSFKILDLVDEDRRGEKKAYVGKVDRAKDRDGIDAIIALGMFKEGANWIWADRSIIIGARSSLVDVIQMVGRLFRDAKGKKHVEVIQLLPFSLDQTNEDEFRENLNNYLKAIYASLILENILHPVRIAIPKCKGKKNTSRARTASWLEQLLPDDAAQLSLVESISNALIDIIDTNKAAGEVSVLWNEYRKISPTILEEYGITEHVEDVGKEIWAMLSRQSLRMQGLLVDDIPFDILQKTSPIAFLLNYTSGICDISTFRHLRTAIRARSFMPYQELKAIIHEMRENGQPLNSAAEYRVWSQSGCNYKAVEKYRRELSRANSS